MTPPRIGIISNHRTWAAQQLAAAFQEHGRDPQLINAEHLNALIGSESLVCGSADNHPISSLHLAVVRRLPQGSPEQIRYRMTVLHHLEESGVRMVNRPQAVDRMVNKYHTSFLLAGAGLRVPETVVTENPAEALKAFKWLGGDVVLKPLFGSQGKGLVRLRAYDTAVQTVESHQTAGQVYYLQRFIPHGNRDLRLFMVGGDLVAAMERRAPGWKTNIYQGGQAAKFSPPRQVIETSRLAAAVMAADYCGIDILPGDDGHYYILEVNGNPGWQGLQSVCSIDIAGLLVEYCLKELQNGGGP